MCIRRQYANSRCGHQQDLAVLHYCIKALNATKSFYDPEDIAHKRADAVRQAIGPSWAANPALRTRPQPCKKAEREREMLNGYCPSCSLKFFDVVDQPQDLTEEGGKFVPKKGFTLSTSSKRRDEYVASMAGFVEPLAWDVEVERDGNANAKAEPAGRGGSGGDSSAEEVEWFPMVAAERIRGGKKEKGRRGRK